jgi:hypothetical protein
MRKRRIGSTLQAPLSYRDRSPVVLPSSGGSGTGPAGPVGPAGPAGPAAAWGAVTGVLGDQVDLAGALAGKAAAVHGHVEADVAGLVADLAAKATKAWTVLARTDTGAVNDWAPAISGHTLIEWAGLADFAPTGLAGGVAGQIVLVKNTGAKVALFGHNGASSAGNKFFNLATSGPTPVAPGGWIAYLHDGAIWQLVGHEQGAWITVTYAAGNFTGSGAMTWAVSLANQVNYSFRLAGRTLAIGLALQATNVGGTADNTLKTAIPLGFVATKYAFASCLINDAGGGFIAGFVQIEIGSQTVDALKYGVTNWALTAGGNTWVRAAIACEVN